jgi:hypothetical protein
MTSYNTTINGQTVKVTVCPPAGGSGETATVRPSGSAWTPALQTSGLPGVILPRPRRHQGRA